MTSSNTTAFRIAAVLVLCLLASCGKQESSTTKNVAPLSVGELRFFEMARSSFQSRNYGRALALTDSIRTQRKDLADVEFLRGRIFFDLMQYANASKAYDNVVALEPDYLGVWHNKGNALFRQRQYRAAVGSYKNEIDNHPAPLPWHALGGAYEALGVADSARLAYEQAIQIDSTYLPAHSSLADWFEREGDFEKALESINTALRKQPNNLDYQATSGRLHQSLGQSADAVVILIKVVEKRPWDYGSMFQLASAYQTLGDTPTATTLRDRANQVRDEQADIDLLANSVKSQPTNFDKLIEYANALRRTQRLEDAVSVYLVAASLRPENLSLQNNIATLLLELGHSEQALALYRQIIQSDSTFGEVWINLAAYYSRSGDAESARDAWANAVRYAPDHPVVQRAMSAGH